MKGMRGVGRVAMRVWCCLLPPNPSFGVSRPFPSSPLMAPHSQTEKPGEALEGLRRETANPVVGEISRGTHTMSASWPHRSTQTHLCGTHVCGRGLCGDQEEQGDGL